MELRDYITLLNNSPAYSGDYHRYTLFVRFPGGQYDAFGITKDDIGARVPWELIDKLQLIDVIDDLTYYKGADTVHLITVTCRMY